MLVMVVVVSRKHDKQSRALLHSTETRVVPQQGAAFRCPIVRYISIPIWVGIMDAGR
jgi:hypothetical protein